MTNRDLFEQPTPPTPTEPNPDTQKGRILALLRSCPEGAANVALNSVCYRYSARIAELRADGFTVHTGPTLANGLVVYTLEE